MFKTALTERLCVPLTDSSFFEVCCFPKCITYISQVYSPSVNGRKPCKYFNFAVTVMGLWRGGSGNVKAAVVERARRQAVIRTSSE